MEQQHQWIITKWYEYTEKNVNGRENVTVKVAKEIQCAECEIWKEINKNY